ncbi:MAG: PilZ domain-containing protein [Marinobacter sp.]|uniref:PilZ domain-containing protein n=1 Tax=Marinobacter sp. TaxID=50741 RepID=UPI00299DFB8D|nr:PilZ domain-containing protein [Marinobacter sp.]MDX1754971.1 PilZ domain-containing protein [Marinobacter sp.]
MARSNGIDEVVGAPVDPELRSDYRLAGKVKVSLELDSGDPEVGNHRSTLAAFTTDLSVDGLCLRCHAPLQEGALLPATVVLETAGRTFSLMTEVVWCRSLGDNQWAAGLQILESDGTSYLEWVETVATAMGQD